MSAKFPGGGGEGQQGHFWPAVYFCLFFFFDVLFVCFKIAWWPSAGKLSICAVLFDFTAAGVVPCGGRKTSPRSSTIVQFIFCFGPLRSAIIF